MTLNPKKLFLTDSMGALLTAFLTGGVLTRFEHLFGMPRMPLYVLAAVACVFAIYSFVCYSRFPQNWHLFLTGIAIANLVYGGVTLGLVFYYYPQLTGLGLAYFLLEWVVILILVFIELRTALKPR